MAITRAAVLGRASGWVGIREDTGNNDCQFSREWDIVGQSWCFAFVHSCFDGQLPHRYMYVPYGVDYARANGQAIENEQVGQVQGGDVVFYTWDTVNWPRFAPGTGDHVGIVETVRNGHNLTVIEGNTLPPGVGGYDGVFRRTDRILDQVVCFWRPTVYIDKPPPPTPRMFRSGEPTMQPNLRLNTDGEPTVFDWDFGGSVGGQRCYAYDFPHLPGGTRVYVAEAVHNPDNHTPHVAFLINGSGDWWSSQVFFWWGQTSAPMVTAKSAQHTVIVPAAVPVNIEAIMQPTELAAAPASPPTSSMFSARQAATFNAFPPPVSMTAGYVQSPIDPPTDTGP